MISPYKYTHHSQEMGQVKTKNAPTNKNYNLKRSVATITMSSNSFSSMGGSTETSFFSSARRPKRDAQSF